MRPGSKEIKFDKPEERRLGYFEPVPAAESTKLFDRIVEHRLQLLDGMNEAQMSYLNGSKGAKLEISLHILTLNRMLHALGNFILESSEDVKVSDEIKARLESLGELDTV